MFGVFLGCFWVWWDSGTLILVVGVGVYVVWGAALVFGGVGAVIGAVRFGVLQGFCLGRVSWCLYFLWIGIVCG